MQTMNTLDQTNTRLQLAMMPLYLKGVTAQELDGIEISIERITPEVAEEYLRRNLKNRPESLPNQEFLVQQIESGNFIFNGDTIVLSSENILIDGQNRLAAIILAGKPVICIVVRGVPPEAFYTKDTGKKRTGGDILSFETPQATEVAAALSVVDRYMTSRMQKGVRYSLIEIKALFDRYPNMIDSVRACAPARKIVPKSILGGLHYMFATKNTDQANEFVANLISGEGLTKQSPIYVLRERLMQNSLAKAKLPHAYLAAITIKAWNHFRNGTVCNQLKFSQDERFPIIQ